MQKVVLGIMKNLNTLVDHQLKNLIAIFTHHWFSICRAK